MDKKIECVYLRDKTIFKNLNDAIIYFDLENEKTNDIKDINEILKNQYEGMESPVLKYW